MRQSPAVQGEGQSEVRGAWFVTARSYVEARWGTETLAQIAEGVTEDRRRAVTDPIASEWYPEEWLQDTLAAAHRIVAKGDRDAFIEFIEGCTEQGVSRFFSVLIELSKPAFILSKVPFMWDRVRRGPGRVVVSARDRGTRLHYSRFPYFGDPLYRMLTVGSLRAVVRRCTGEEPDVRIVDFSDDECVVDVLHD